MIDKILMVFVTIKPIGAITLALLTFFAPINTIIHGMLVLVGIDLITGIIAHFKKNDIKFCWFRYTCWQKITSHGLGQTISKMLVYMLLVITGFIIDTLVIPNSGLWVTKVMAGSTGLRELKSIIENTEIILGGGIITYIKLVAKHGFQGAFNKMLEEKEKRHINCTIEDCKKCPNEKDCPRSKLKN